MERMSFQHLVVGAAKKHFEQNLHFVNGVDIFQVLDPEERTTLAEVLMEEEFDNDEAILEQGETDNKMYRGVTRIWPHGGTKER